MASAPRVGVHQLDGQLADRDIQILHELERYRLLSTRQLQRLCFPARPYGEHTSISAATRATTRVLTRLAVRHAITRLTRQIGGIRHGSAVGVWQLGPAGEAYLRSRRGQPGRRRYVEPSYAFLAHTLAVADIAVSLTEQARLGRFELLELQAEPDCWRNLNGPEGTAATLKPDLSVVTADPDTETHSFVEVDRDTEHLSTVVRKCHLYQRYRQTGAEQAARGMFPAVVWVTPDAVRTQQITEAIAADPGLDGHLFYTVVTESALRSLAPYDDATGADAGDSSPNAPTT